MTQKTIYNLPDMTLKSFKKRATELLDEAIEITNDAGEKRGLIWARYIVNVGRLVIPYTKKAHNDKTG